MAFLEYLFHDCIAQWHFHYKPHYPLNPFDAGNKLKQTTDQYNHLFISNKGNY